MNVREADHQKHKVELPVDAVDRAGDLVGKLVPPDFDNLDLKGLVRRPPGKIDVDVVDGKERLRNLIKSPVVLECKPVLSRVLRGANLVRLVEFGLLNLVVFSLVARRHLG